MYRRLRRMIWAATAIAPPLSGPHSNEKAGINGERTAAWKSRGEKAEEGEVAKRPDGRRRFFMVDGRKAESARPQQEMTQSETHFDSFLSFQQKAENGQ